MKPLHNHTPLVFLALVLLIGGIHSCQQKPCPEPQTIVVHDTIFVPDNSLLWACQDSLAQERRKYQKLAVRYDSVRQDAIVAKMQIGQAKKYIKICERKPSQKVFLLGWMRRAFDM